MATTTRTIAAISALTAALLAGCGAADTRSGPSPDRFRGAEGIEIPPGPSEPSWWIDPVIDHGGAEPPESGPVTIRATVPADTLFESGSSEITSSAEEALVAVYNSLGDAAIFSATLDCHADSTGDTAANQTLSDHRAANLSAWMTAHWAVPEGQLTARGHGETQPVAINDTPSGRAQNRRCDVTLTIEGPT